MAEFQSASAEQFTGFDLVGDVHGCYKTLLELLETLGYVRVRGTYQYRDQQRPRQLIFLGDLVDRGPAIRPLLHLVRDMVERGSAVVLMGNHEYHTALYLTPSEQGGYLRRHTDHSNNIIAQTLKQFANYGQELQEFKQWMSELPLFYQHRHFRAVHAFWDEDLIDRFVGEHHRDNLSHQQFVQSALEPKGDCGRLVKRLTTGLTLALPDEHVIVGREGQHRRRFRVRFWGGFDNLGDTAFQPDPLPDSLSQQQLSASTRQWLSEHRYGPERRPLFIGHYWLHNQPQQQCENIACLDYSAVLGGQLVAYRMDDETRLHRDKFVTVDYRD
ncbi:Bis(5'-nucleosyl)-tetraphosphatase, symmetrical [Sinobacterium norvegicum]|uniref:Bis(5'-nucleosyl)-tetraphosphatase, symmetrical n=1 Tax=Sinobacterium norvegicum TaxID=1641715 RepID=A0ABM9AH87_9GAMM|nr:metallophosphoesterase [Sinobacterium norvegicum]CAH0992506.1 Bis(5'-nucleosyl)-tetraphosphatase, symmetrical [Sinobacterium norvegicum]